jgi:glycosyltransferase involved in cell wall biosynthesis
MGAGRAVVSTPYVYAEELLANGRGVLVEPASADSLSDALNMLLGDHALRREIGRRAYQYTRSSIWPAVGARYRDLFAGIVAGAEPMPGERLLPAPVGAATHG